MPTPHARTKQNRSRRNWRVHETCAESCQCIQCRTSALVHINRWAKWRAPTGTQRIWWAHITGTQHTATICMVVWCCDRAFGRAALVCCSGHISRQTNTARCTCVCIQCCVLCVCVVVPSNVEMCGHGMDGGLRGIGLCVARKHCVLVVGLFVYAAPRDRNSRLANKYRVFAIVTFGTNISKSVAIASGGQKHHFVILPRIWIYK